MVAKVNTMLSKPLSGDVRTVRGRELRSLHAIADSQYLVIELGNSRDHTAGFTKTMQVAMIAAVNAVLASMQIYGPVESKETGKPAASGNSADDKVAAKHARTERNARRREELNQRILADALWLTARELSEKASFKNSNPSAGPNRWKSAGSIFALQINGKDLYPEYALDEGFRPFPVVKQVISLFGDKKTPWGLATWFGSANSWLGGRKPKDVLKTMPKQILLAAQAEIDGGLHG